MTNLLDNFELEEDFGVDNNVSNLLHDVRMQEAIQSDPCLTEEDFNLVLKMIELKKKEKYQFLMKAVSWFQDSNLQTVFHGME